MRVATSVGRLVSGRLRVGPPRPRPTLLVSTAGADTVRMPSTVETRRPGRYGIYWTDGEAVLGDIVSGDNRTVTRTVLTGDRPGPGTLVRWNKLVYRGDPRTAHGIDFAEVVIDGPLGALPAWFVPGRRDTWVVLVHGNRVTREETLRALPIVVDAGFPALVPAYRNDPGAPLSPDGYYHLGDTEWEDLDRAVEYALREGASDVVLFGWSMGGNIVETFLDRSARAERVRAVVLDAPLLNPEAALNAQLRRLGVPHIAGSALKRLVANGSGIDFRAIDHEHRTGRRDLPTLLFHGTDDIVVPVGSSDVFARRYAGQVTYRRVTGAGHALAWNVDPGSYRDELDGFLATVALGA